MPCFEPQRSMLQQLDPLLSDLPCSIERRKGQGDVIENNDCMLHAFGSQFTSWM